MAISTSTHAATTPNAISGSGRRPLLNGSHAARNTAPAVQHGDPVGGQPPAQPRQHAPADRSARWRSRPAVAGSRIHTPAVLIGREVGEHRLVPVERRLGGAEVAVVVGGVAGLAGDAGDGEVVAVVRRGGADRRATAAAPPITPRVGEPGRGPGTPERRATPRAIRRLPRRSSTASATIEATTHSTPSTITAVLSGGGGGDEPGVDVDARRQARLRRHLQVGEDACDLRLLLGRQRCPSHRGCR